MSRSSCRAGSSSAPAGAGPPRRWLTVTSDSSPPALPSSKRLYSEGVDTVGRSLVFFGVVIAVVGAVLMVTGRLGLPGDITFRRSGFTLYAPLGTSTLISIVLTVALNLFLRAKYTFKLVQLVLGWPVRIVVLTLLAISLFVDGAGYLYRYANHYPLTGPVSEFQAGGHPHFDWWPLNNGQIYIVRGLDLQGGSHLVIQLIDIPAGRTNADVQATAVSVL